MPLVRTRAFAEPFEYELPEELEDRVREGSLVVVPLHRRAIVGLVLERRSEPRHPGALLGVLDDLDLPPVPAELLALARQVAAYYLVPLPAALALVAPPPGALRVTRRYEVTAAGRAAAAAGDEGALALDGLPAGDASLRTRADRYRRRGWLRIGHRVGIVGRPDAGPLLALGDAVPPSRLGPRQRAALGVLAERGPLTERELRHLTGLALPGLRRLVSAGAIVEEGAPRQPWPAGPAPDPAAATAARRAACVVARDLPALLPEQRAALDAVLCDARPGDEVLLHGVTGSGKTEVYLQAAAATLQSGRSVLLLVPEIGLTGQTVDRVRARFGDETIAVLHSGLSAGERLAAYLEVASGRARIVVGARSAVFAPAPRLGLVVVDEEHDTSYKQENMPAYDARRVARWRAERSGAVVLLASATPSVEAYARVPLHVDLPRRVDGSPPPPLEIVDMRDQHAVFSDRLAAALTGAVEHGEKAILFLNRRGYAAYLVCDHCGHTWECPRCDLTLTLFGSGTLRCRACGHREAAPAVCPACGSLDVIRFGIGTERVEREVRALVPGVELLRLDSDVAASHGRLRSVLRRFSRPGPSVLVGTQMIAKGHHFPDVTLVGVVNADITLRFPDFRAEERTFAMLVQVGGRSGRGPRPGRVIVQTLDPEARPIALAASGEWERFYAEELERRRLLAYPPATHLVGLEVSSLDPEKTAKAGVYVAGKAERLLMPDATVLGPGPSWRERGRSACRVLVKTVDIGKTLERLGPWVDRYGARFAERGVRLVADVDPQWL
jgi:primosomal protein N' (replication factor Y)